MKAIRLSAVWAILCLLGAQQAFAQEAGTAAKMVTWQPKPGMERNFEEGYKRHLEWHRKNSDPWVWHGWTLMTGEHEGWFVDGTFFHPWTDFDSPLKLAEDGADNAVNVYPNGDVRNLLVLEAVPDLSNVPAEGLKSPLMMFVRLSVVAGNGGKLETALKSALQAPELATWQRLVFRPVSGSSDYLMFVPLSKQAELGAQQQRVRAMLEAVQGKSPTPLITSAHTDLARYRAEMSYSRK